MTFWTKLNKFQPKAGDDYTSRYVKNNNAYFYLGAYLINTKEWKTIVLKPFLKTFDISMSFKLQEDNLNKSMASSYKAFESTSIKYTIAIEVPSESINEAKINAEKMDFLMGMLTPSHQQKSSKSTAGTGNKPGSKITLEELAKVNECKKLAGAQAQMDCLKKLEAEQKAAEKRAIQTGAQTGPKPKTESSQSTVVPSQNHFYVSFANLIQSGKYKLKHVIESGTDIQKYGLFCDIDSIKITPDLEMGFFEEKKKIYPKSYSVSFTLIPKDKISHNAKRVHIRGYETDGTYATIEGKGGNKHTYDIKSWPFGVS